MIKSRAKHARGNREFAGICRQAGFSAVACSFGVIKNDGLPGLSVEVRRTQRLHMDRAMAAAAEKAGENIPLVAHRGDFQPWRITLELEGFLRLYWAYLQTYLPDPERPESEAYPGSDPALGHPL